MADPELERLLIANLDDLEAASQHIYTELQPAVARALNNKLEASMKLNNWAGKSDFENNYLWLAPPDWERETGEEEDFECWFQMDTLDADKEEAIFWLSLLVGDGSRQMGLRWCRDVTKLRRWKLALKGQPEIISRLCSKGFLYQDSTASFFLPLRIDRNALSNAIGEESPVLAMAPFDDALQVCINAKSDFDALLAATSGINEV